MASKESKAKYIEEVEVVNKWSTAVLKLERLTRETEETRQELAEIERRYPFLGNLKGVVRKTSSRSTSSDQDSGGTKSPVAASAEPPRGASVQTTSDKKRKANDQDGGNGKKNKLDE